MCQQCAYMSLTDGIKWTQKNTRKINLNKIPNFHQPKLWTSSKKMSKKLAHQPTPSASNSSYIQWKLLIIKLFHSFSPFLLPWLKLSNSSIHYPRECCYTNKTIQKPKHVKCKHWWEKRTKNNHIICWYLE